MHKHPSVEKLKELSKFYSTMSLINHQILVKKKELLFLYTLLFIFYILVYIKNLRDVYHKIGLLLKARVIMFRKNKGIAGLIFLIISFFIFHYSLTIGLSVIQTISSSILYPFLRFQHAIIIPVSQLLNKRMIIKDLEEIIYSLKQKNEQLMAENNALRGFMCYENQTKELYQFNKRYHYKGIVAQVLAKHCSDTQQFFLVDAGSNQGIKKDTIALYCNAIVGKVVEVYPWYCKVSLITDSECKIAVICLSENESNKNNVKIGATGIHEGTNTPYTTVRYVSHLQSIKVNDIIFSSGEGLIFPKGFALGRVIEADKGDLFYNIKVEPIINLSELNYCTLISKEEIGL